MLGKPPCGIDHQDSSAVNHTDSQRYSLKAVFCSGRKKEFLLLQSSTGVGGIGFAVELTGGGMIGCSCAFDMRKADQDDAAYFLRNGGSEKVFEVRDVCDWQETFWMRLEKHASKVDDAIYTVEYGQ